MFTGSANNIITNVSFIKSILEKDDKLEPTITPSYILKDKDSIDAFTKEVEEKG